ncbi:unnamed protein product [Umbelopsis ramanniana]
MLFNKNPKVAAELKLITLSITMYRLRSNAIRRYATHPQHANPQAPQRTGPTPQAIALAAGAVGLGYWMFAKKSDTKAKDEAGSDISLKHPEKTTHSDKLVGGAGSAKA